MVRSVVRTKVSEKQDYPIRMRTYVATHFVTNFAQMLDLGSNLRTNMHPACAAGWPVAEAKSRNARFRILSESAVSIRCTTRRREENDETRTHVKAEKATVPWQC